MCVRGRDKNQLCGSSISHIALMLKNVLTVYLLLAVILYSWLSFHVCFLLIFFTPLEETKKKWGFALTQNWENKNPHILQPTHSSDASLKFLLELFTDAQSFFLPWYLSFFIFHYGYLFPGLFFLHVLVCCLCLCGFVVIGASCIFSPKPIFFFTDIFSIPVLMTEGSWC